MRLASLVPGLVLLTCFSLGCDSPAPPAESAETVTPSGAGRFDHLESVQAMGRFRETLDDMIVMVLEDAETEREASEGMRFLLRTIAMSSEVTGDANPGAPHFTRMDTLIRKVGGDNPDAEYDQVQLDNAWDYVVRGNIGTVKHVSFTIMGGSGPGRRASIGYFNERTIGADENGDFEIHLSKTEQGTNWVDTSEGLSSILVRQYIGDRTTEALATYDIAVIGQEPYSELAYSTDAEMAQRIDGTSWTFRSLSTLHRTVMPDLLSETNRFVRANSDDFGADISSSDNLYMFGSFEIDEDEALIIETEPLDVRYWNIAVESRWHETIDYRKRRTHRSLDDVEIDSDGKLRFVLAHGKTPHPNWLDTGGHRKGFLTFRWVGDRDSETPLPTVVRIKRADVAATLETRQAAR